MDPDVVAARLESLLDYLRSTDEPDLRWLRVELEALAKSMWRHPADDDAPPGTAPPRATLPMFGAP